MSRWKSQDGTLELGRFKSECYPQGSSCLLKIRHFSSVNAEFGTKMSRWRTIE
jgi:hypothetical protein